jgi:hypothetical protein
MPSASAFEYMFDRASGDTIFERASRLTTTVQRVSSAVGEVPTSQSVGEVLPRQRRCPVPGEKVSC